MTYSFRLLTLVTAFFVINCGANSRNNSDQSLTDDYSARIDSLIQTEYPRKFNGVIFITKNEEIKYVKAYGYSDFEGETQISLNDNFRIQSNSKQITAVLILKEVENGSINLDSPISTYLSEFEQPWADSITVHQLLNMSSGIIGLNEPLAFEPGTDYRYSNSSYSLLGRILHSVTGKTYTRLANDLFKELGMHNTYCYEFGENQKSLINGYLNSKDGYQLVDFYSRGITPDGWTDFIPAGGIISNAHDLNVWDHHLHSGNILRHETYTQMINYSIKGQHAAFGEDKIGYGYGLRIDKSKPTTIIGHAGKGIGFVNTKLYVPKNKLSIIVLENIYDEDPDIVYHFEREIKNIVMSSNLVK